MRLSLAFLALWISVHVLFVVVVDPGVLHGDQIDTDGYMRLVRVERLLETGAWYDGTVARSNWPFGAEHHWTRPLDVLILALALPFRLLFSWAVALKIAGALVSPVCHLAACLAAVWLVRPMVPGPERSLAMPAMLVQPGLLAYGTAGRADHHALILLLFILALGCWIRALLEPARKGPPLAAGALSGLGIWVSPESLLPLLLLFAAGALAWVFRGEPLRVPNRRLCAGLAAALAVAIPLQRTPSTWFERNHDQISLTHLAMALVALAFWWLVGLARRHAVATAAAACRSRLLLGLAGAAAAAVLIRLVDPRFFLGPWADVDPAVIDVWLHRVRELQPLLPLVAADIGPFLIHLGPGLVLLPAAILWLRRESSPARRAVWSLLVLSLLVYLPLAAAQVRFSGYVGVIAAILSVEAVRRLLVRADTVKSPIGLRLARVGTMAAVLLGGHLVGTAAGAVSGGLAASAESHTDAADRPRHRPGDRPEPCSLAGIATILADPAGLGHRPRTIVAHIDFGPELLYRTPHRVLAGPYHRNRRGILDAYRMLTATDDDTARRFAAEREVDLVLLCPPVDRAYFGGTRNATLYARLVTGRDPRWLRRVPLAVPAPSGFLLFRTTRSVAGGGG